MQLSGRSIREPGEGEVWPHVSRARRGVTAARGLEARGSM